MWNSDFKDSFSLPPSFSLSLSPYSITRFIKKFISLFLIQQTQKEHLPFSRLGNLWQLLISQLNKELTTLHKIAFDSWIRKICWRRDRLPTPAFLGFPCGSAGKESACNAGDLHSLPGLGRSLGEGKGYTLQYSGLENSIDCLVHGVPNSQTRLSNFHSLTHVPQHLLTSIIYSFAQHLQCENSRKAKIFFCSLLYHNVHKNPWPTIYAKCVMSAENKKSRQCFKGMEYQKEK